MHKSIRIKLLSAFLTIIAIFSIAEGFFVVINYNIINHYKNLVDQMVSEYQIMDDSSAEIESFKNFVKDTNDSDKSEQYNTDSYNLKALIIYLEPIINDPDSKAIFNGLKNTLNNISAELNDGVNEALRGDYSEMTTHYDKAVAYNNFVRENTTKLLLQQMAYAKSLEDGIRLVQYWSEIAAFILFFLVALGCLWYSISFSKKLIDPLTNLTKLAKVIEGGNLKAIVEGRMLDGDDEVASLAKSFNTMVLSLRQSIQKLQEYNIEIKDSSNRLKSEKNKLQQYLDIAGVIVLIFSPDTNKVLLINKKGRELLGVELSDIVSQDWVSTYVSKDGRTQTKSFLNIFLSGINPVNDTLENILVAKDKKEKNIVWHFSTLKNNNGAVEAVLATGADVTELKAAQITIGQLKEVDRLKNEVMNIATHELKTPLISIVGLSEVMEKKPETLSPDYKNYISIIHNEGLKLSNLIKTMLSSTRNELGKTTIAKERFDLAVLLLSLKTSLKVLVKRTESQVAFEIKTKGTEAEINSNKDKISQVVYNFVDNAVKYGPKNQTISILLSKPDEKTLKVEVAGAGAGISVDDQKKLFMKFSQLEPSLSRSQDGMGLGLYICKQNIENLGGQIGVVSASGQGATFYFTLPITTAKIEKNSETKI